MRPKGKLFVLLVLLTAIGLVTASGAFTTVTAQRTATVNTAGDEAAILQLQANSTYADNSGDTLNVDFKNSGNSLNVNATIQFDYVFNVTNNGDQTVAVNISDNAETVLGAEDDFIIYNASAPTNTIETSGNAVNLGPGDSLEVGIKVDTTGLSSGQSFDVSMNVTADAV